MIDREAPARRPDGRPAGFQRWQKLLFLHWPLPPERVRPSLPPALELDCWQGQAWIGVVPFTMRDVSPWWSPAVPGISHFHELNLRTYVVCDGVPGVWFYSLDAANSLAVVVARAGWKLPYHKAQMSLEQDGDTLHYRSRRRWPKPTPADFEARYRIGAARGSAAPGSFDHFLVERYVLFARDGDQLLSGRVHHQPYPLREVVVETVEQSLIAAAGLGAVEGPPLAHYSDGVDVDVYRLAPAGPSIS